MKLEIQKRIDVRIMLKILEVLQKRDKIKRTPLSSACGMSYDRLMKYLIFLQAVKLTSQTSEKEGIFVSITKIGIDVHSALTVVKN